VPAAADFVRPDEITCEDQNNPKQQNSHPAKPESLLDHDERHIFTLRVKRVDNGRI
jgi:hypothetical protein